jgi:predicted RND superfamily exporter protein
VILLALIATVVAPLGVARVVIQDSWIDGFAPSSEFYQATQEFNDQFLGTHLLLVSVDTGHYVLSGEVGMDALDHHSATLPAGLASDPQSLVGNQLLFRRIGEPARARRTQRRSKIPSEWRVRIESVVRQGDQIVATWPRRGGSPLIVMAPPDGARFAYEITPQRLLSPETLGQIGELEKFIEARREDAVGGVLGTATYLATANFMSRGRREGTRCIPDSIPLVDQAWKRYKLARGQVRLDQAVDPDYARSLVTVFLKNANFVATGRLMNEIRQYERTHLQPQALQFAGDVAVSQTLIDAIVSTQVRSLLLSLAGIVALTAVLGRSLAWGLGCVLPCALAVLINFAVMGWVQMPLGVATSMFAGMTLGIGVDYAIHLLERYRLSRRQGLETEAALTEAVSTTGPAVLVDALGVALGFGVMTLSQVPANARLGALLVMSIVGCLTVTLLLLPALLRVCARRPAGA